MNRFRDAEVAGRARERLEKLTHVELDLLFDSGFDSVPDPDLALTNLERWMSALSNPGTYAQYLVSAPRLAEPLLAMLGSGQHLADILIQNPELASILTDPRELSKLPTRDVVEAEGRALLRSATSYSHALDRLRYLKQRWMLPLVMNDLMQRADEEVIWTSLSDLADALVTLTVERVWSESFEGPCQVMVVAFGKLGGREVNYSSDIDLVYVFGSDLPESEERRIHRFCETLTRAMSDRMGRGSLYRVDLRLRPYGGAGAIIRTMRSYETYYRSHAEPWERQALLRTRPVCGPDALQDRWHELVESICFGARLSELALEEMLTMRKRIEERASDADLKRGAGGIRDVEFFAQALQLVHGRRLPSIRHGSTCQVLRALAEEGLIEQHVMDELSEGYRFLRQLEHRCQLVGDQQTHSVPDNPDSRDHLAKLLGFRDWSLVAIALDAHRHAIRTIYERSFGICTTTRDVRTEAFELLAPHESLAATWLDSFPESEAFFESLIHNEGSLRRVRRILHDAPTVLPFLMQTLVVTEHILSGEIEEDADPSAVLKRLAPQESTEIVAMAVRRALASALCRWTLLPETDLGASLASIYDALLAHARARFQCTFDIVALGSYSLLEGSPKSDLDLLLLVRDRSDHSLAEEQAQGWLAWLKSLKRWDVDVDIDLRLRPEGSKGLLVRTYNGLSHYGRSDMEMWERFAVAHHRMVEGDVAALDIVRECAFEVPLTPEKLVELFEMKTRIETERVAPRYRTRDLKLGYGGLSDIDWLVGLHLMRYPTALSSERWMSIDDRIREMAQAWLINSIERDELLAGHAHLKRIRNRLALLGYDSNILPENPDKLDRLAHAEGLESGNAFLAVHEPIVESVRAIYLGGLDRLGLER